VIYKRRPQLLFHCLQKKKQSQNKTIKQNLCKAKNNALKQNNIKRLFLLGAPTLVHPFEVCSQQHLVQALGQLSVVPLLEVTTKYTN